ncbi:hypothetical protein K1T71_001476 [Dendrolimus kikuchii]|uniref:Uncharacterized protein n=1 Tax=Dendrolimus kikuchii TaxID=765133 RepID=A0ACC1DI19_9NEOP|nr:hypothetical protein K1T71_001476 [Dendrolimus kikuchii]
MPRNVESDDLRDLIKKRGIIKGKFTLFVKYVQTLDKTKITELQKAELNERLLKSESLFDKFSDIQDEIELNMSEFQLEKELLEREAFENQFYEIMAQYKCFLKESGSLEHSFCQSNRNFIKLPTISLPSFDGTYDQWLEFRDTFQSLIHNNNDIDNVQKFHYLRSALTGAALQVIKSLEFSSENYITAWDLLENRYNNNRLLVHNHVKALFSAQSISKESAVQIRKLIDTILRNIRALKTLDLYLCYTCLCSSNKLYNNSKGILIRVSQLVTIQILPLYTIGIDDRRIK